MKTSLIALALAAALPFAASAAEGLSYNYAEADYAKTDIDGGKADGWGVKGSWAFHQNFHVFGDFDRQEIDHTNARFNQWRVGVGFNKEIANSTDFVARAAYQKLDLRYADLDFNGYSAEAGIRTAFGQHAEVYALAGYEDFDKKHGVEPLDGGQFYGRLGGQVKLNQNWGINGDIKMNRHGDKEWTVGPRFSW
ncbi:Ax21 family protein [Stenotrophomonas sp. ATCM1_4]|jgi:Ax21 family sulfation-dependent quorum factor|uniref:Ax21 family protein n=1 Tax=Stenotrophomonas capsici TaxID=3110230 RepID=A0ABU5UYM2_9GAMM|nr:MULTISPECIES: Ax21 family protein [unclassified Stenotrophomonas]MBD9535735.1 Ax21 family protein [Stenotrophomonas sp. STM01]MEA5666178.1 Ax21 family protein [Stenotrophomonas sp. MH1]TDB27132.1 Ax21 family protein [Stenotrophomonas sp. ATCM1_4]